VRNRRFLRNWCGSARWATSARTVARLDGVYNGSPIDPSEILKEAPQIIKAAGPIAASIPFTGTLKRMLGPAADEVAEMWRDKVRLYRYSQQIKCVEKAEKMAEEAGFIPKSVPPRSFSHC
jgi:hypothetical protein